MPWARRRKFIYISGIIIFFLLVVVLPLGISLYKAPTCFDNKQNGDELGVDCGGVCTLLCPSQYVPLTVLWSRFSKVNDGVYNVLAYIQNQNINAGAANLNYSFKLYDKKGVLLKERAGITFAPANKLMAVFEPDLVTGNSEPTRVEFSFTSNAVWVKQESKETGLSVSQVVMSREDSAPRLTFTLTNKKAVIVERVEAIVIVYNALGNTVAFSRTTVDSLAGGEVRPVSFNWPRPFIEPQTRSEIILKVLK